MTHHLTRAEFDAASPTLVAHHVTKGGPMMAVVTEIYETTLGRVRRVHSMGGESFEVLAPGPCVLVNGQPTETRIDKSRRVISFDNPLSQLKRVTFPSWGNGEPKL